MKICLVHNEYAKPSGEEVVVDAVHRLLSDSGHQVIPFMRSSAEIQGHLLGHAKGFFTGIYNPAARLAMRRLLREHRPDVVHIHNLFPLISPSILGECTQARIPVVMTVHNCRLVCPVGLHMSRGHVCEKCAGGREYQCIVNRCAGGLLKSAGYAIRNAVARKMRFFHDNVTMYAALTEFQRQRLIAEGFPAHRIAVVPNMTYGHAPREAAEPGSFVGYCGRVSPEKGVETLVSAAREMPDVQFRVAGDYARMAHLPAEAPANMAFLGHQDASRLAAFYRDSRMVVLPSRCFEGFPSVLLEAMLHGRPTVCSRIGGLGEIVDDGRTGLLFSPGDARDLATKIRLLWDRPDLCRAMGLAGRARVMRDYSSQQYYTRLMAVYRQAASIVKCGAHTSEQCRATALVANAA